MKTADEALKEIRRSMEYSRLAYAPDDWNIIHDELERLKARVESATRNETAAISERDELRREIDLLKQTKK